MQRKKKRPDTTDELPPLAKKHKQVEFVQEASQLEGEFRRPPRTGAGTGGRIAQLKLVEAAIDTAPRGPKPLTTLPSDSQQNPLAPAPLIVRRRRKVYLFIFYVHNRGTKELHLENPSDRDHKSSAGVTRGEVHKLQ